MLLNSDIITGEKFQRLADVSVTTKYMMDFHRSLGDVKTYILPLEKIKKAEDIVLSKINSQKSIQKIKNCLFKDRLPKLIKELIEKSEDFLNRITFRKFKRYKRFFECIKLEIPQILNNAKIIFVYGDLLNKFFTYIYPHLKQKFILISHNSDTPITKKFSKFLRENKIIRWYSPNCEVSHSKLIPIPLGIANAYWGHGNEAIIKKAMEFNQKKKRKAYSNFSIKTNPKHRLKVYHLIKDNPFVVETRKKSFFNYLLDLSSFKYSITPRGNGQDCHRLWESLYLGVIPIIDDRMLYRNFSKGIWKGTPILFIDDWRKLSQKFANKSIKSTKVKNNNWKKNLDFQFWKKLIENDKKQY